MPVRKSRRQKKGSAAGRTRAGSGRSSRAELNALRSMIASLMQAGLADEPEDDLGRAQELIYQAWEAESPEERLALAAKALEISPLCADAYVLMAQHAEPLSDARIDLLRRGVAAGKAALGDAAFADDVGHFWGILETRPYMRARSGLAMALWERGGRDEPLEHLRDMLRLNPNDNQGLRYVLAAYLLEIGRDEELADLLKTYEEDGAAAWVWTKAVAAFRRSGDGRESRRSLDEAFAQNAFVASYLLGERRIPKARPPFISDGGQDEAICYADEFGRGWAQTPGALDWLRRQREASKTKTHRRARV